MPTPQDADSIASRLCAQCGMCCNGVMFHTVWLQPGDSAGKLQSLGIKLKWKKKEHYFRQPCTAHRDMHCTIYLDRPTRCRLFECRQLKAIAAGKITEEEALAKITEARQRIAVIEELLRRTGDTDPTRPLSKRCDYATAEPSDPEDTAAVELRTQLTRAMEELDAMLDRDFRNEQK